MSIGIYELRDLRRQAEDGRNGEYDRFARTILRLLAEIDRLRATGEPVRAKQYDRSALVDTMTFHWPTPTSGCMCGWSDLGCSFPEHLADAYEATGEPVTSQVARGMR